MCELGNWIIAHARRLRVINRAPPLRRKKVWVISWLYWVSSLNFLQAIEIVPCHTSACLTQWSRPTVHVHHGSMCQCLCKFEYNTADSAQPRNRSVVIRLFYSWEGGVWARDYLCWWAFGHETNEPYLTCSLSCTYTAVTPQVKSPFKEPDASPSPKMFPFVPQVCPCNKCFSWCWLCSQGEVPKDFITWYVILQNLVIIVAVRPMKLRGCPWLLLVMIAIMFDQIKKHLVDLIGWEL